MAISLTASQQTIEGLFCNTSEQFIIPQYQRPYSWTFDQCSELFRDVMSAFEDKDSYFLGNIIFARSNDFDINGKSNVVDGQQRLITVWILIKVLSLFLEDVNTLKTALSIVPWRGDANEPKIMSTIFENKDNDALKYVFSIELSRLGDLYDEYVKKHGELKEDKCSTQMEATLLFFYEQIKNSVSLKSEDKLAEFAQYLMKKVSMLPIVQTADDEDKATDKALTIFETINNRGLDLEDADIFKARLYNSASTNIQKDEFISLWVDFKTECDSLKISIDDAFRYYSHVIRGREGITTSEKRLRDFFTNESYSPITYKTYDEVLTDLNKILDALKYIKSNTGHGDAEEPGPWLQILTEYTNQYPIYAVVVYLYNHDIASVTGKENFVNFLQSLVRYCLYTGSTTSVKFGIYSIIKNISYSDRVDDYRRTDITTESFNHIGRLKNSFALLTYLLDTGNEIPKKYTIDKIVNLRDEDLLDETWYYDNLNDICNSVGNLVVLDIPKKYISLVEKYNHYKTSKLKYVNSIFIIPDYTFSEWKARNVHMKNLLVNFFENKKS